MIWVCDELRFINRTYVTTISLDPVPTTLSIDRSVGRSTQGRKSRAFFSTLPSRCQRTIPCPMCRVKNFTDCKVDEFVTHKQEIQFWSCHRLFHKSATCIVALWRRADTLSLQTVRVYHWICLECFNLDVEDEDDSGFREIHRSLTC